MEILIQNRQNNCRLCLKTINTRSIEISKSIEKRFEQITNLKLVMLDHFSKIICERCNSRLSELADFKNELTEIQLKYYDLLDCPVSMEYSSVVLKDEAVKHSAEEKIVKDELIGDCQIEALDESFHEPERSQINTATVCSQNELTTFSKRPKKKKSQGKRLRKMCQLCGLSFATNGWYHHMLRAHTESIRFQCDYCGKGFRVKHDLKDHLQTHLSKESRKKFACSSCPALLLSKSALKNHEQIYHSDVIEEHPCECGKIFGSRIKLYQHRRTVHTKGLFPCTSCDKVYTVKNVLQKHIIKNHRVKEPCTVCGKLFTPGMFMKRHMINSHGPAQYFCDFDGCEKHFHSRSALSYHIDSQHKPLLSVDCPTCKTSYNSVRNLNRHIARQHNTYRVQCEVQGCSHTAARKDYLAAHYRSHKDIDENMRKGLLDKVKSIKVISW